MTLNSIPDNGWFPFISPDGRYIAAGFGGGVLYDLHTGASTTITRRFFPGGWLDDIHLVAGFDDAVKKTALLTVITSGGQLTFAEQDLVPFTFSNYAAGAGHWGGAIAAQSVWLDGRIIASGRIGGCRMDRDDASLVYADYRDNTFILYRTLNGQLVQTVNCIGNNNEYRVGARGHIGFGYSGPSWLSFPDGRQEQVNVTPVESPSLPFLYNEALWLVSCNDEGVYIRPHGAKDYIHVPIAGCVHVDLVPVGKNFLVAGNDNKGRLQYAYVPADSPRRVYVPPTPAPQPEPEPIPTPKRPRVTITSYTQQVTVGQQARMNAAVSGGPADTISWLTRRSGESTWRVDATNPASDLDHGITYASAGAYEIAARVQGPGGSDQTGAERIVRVVPVPQPEPEPEPIPEPEPVPTPIPEPQPVPRKLRWWQKLLRFFGIKV